MKASPRAIVALLSFAIALSLVTLGLELTRPTPEPAAEQDGGAPHKYGVTVALNPAMQVPQWYVDPGNVTGCASDSNNGTTATCGSQPGIGPLLTWNALNTQRWGCTGGLPCPRLLQSTNITFLSSQTGTGDPIVFQPSIETAGT